MYTFLTKKMNINLSAIFILAISKLSATVTTDHEVSPFNIETTDVYRKFTSTTKRKEQEITTDDIETTPACRKSLSEKQREVLCQGERLEITCLEGTVTFIEANFGRSSPEPCKEYFGREDKTCYTKRQTLSKLRTVCHDTNRCSIEVSKSFFKSSCWLTTKYLDVTYACERIICNGKGQAEISPDQVTTTVPFSYTLTNNNTEGQANISADQTTTISPYIITQPDINTTDSSQNISEIDHDVVEVQTNHSRESMTKTETQNETQVLTIIGIVLGIVLAGVIFIVLWLVTKQKRHLCTKSDSSSNSLEMQLTTNNGRGYQYDYSEVRTGPSVSGSGRVSNERSEGLENMYENSTENDDQVRTDGSGPLDDAYDVTNGGRRTPLDVNNTYDHMFGEQTEDQYDIGLTTSTVVTDNVDDIYL